MKASRIALLVVVFVLGVTAGVFISQLNGTSIQPTSSMSSIDQREAPVTPPALIARFDQMDARLSELTAALNRIDDRRISGMGPPADEHQLSAYGRDDRNKHENDQASKSAVTVAKFEQIKGRLLDSLQDPATNITTLMNSNEMHSLSPEQQNEVMQEVATRLDTGQLRKEQFLPGYRPKTGIK